MTAIDQDASANVLNIRVDAIDMPGALCHMRKMLLDESKSYVCVAGVHGVMEAGRRPALAKAYAQSALVIPDGMPLVWVGQLQGHQSMRRVTGPDFMLEMFRRKEFRTVKHFLYGGEPGVVEELRWNLLRRFPYARIVGVGTPPFQALSPEERNGLIEEIRTLQPDIIWVGISCPKQELFMQEYLPLLDARIMVGVGAAFDYHTGRIRDSAEWVKRAGLQWVHRLIQDPRRLWRRYLFNNPPFVVRIVYQLLREQMVQDREQPLQLHLRRSADGAANLKQEAPAEPAKSSAVA
jgi:N-acetylglucosaminyldiphosphoundecaprenol N-acetyl-beta-D-mannosaminyltransferase